MPLELFYSYAHEDSQLRDQLDVHLSQLVHDGLISPWVDRRIAGGDEWRSQIDFHVRSARIILLLVSPDFLASEYCYDVEMRLALERHAKGEAVVVPVILRPADWQSAPFAELQALPREARAVTLWENRDEAFAQIARAIREIVQGLQHVSPVPNPVPLTTQPAADHRVVDAAMPGHVVKDRAAELLVLIRLPESKGLAGVLQEDSEAEARPEDVRSKPFDVAFPVGPTGRREPLKIEVKLTSPDFLPPSQTKNIFVPLDRDSEICPFLLTPLRAGPLIVAIELIWEDAERGYRRLRTNCVAESEIGVAKPAMALARMEIGTARPALRPAREPLPIRPAPTKKSFLSNIFVKAGLAAAALTIGCIALWIPATNHLDQASVSEVQSDSDPAPKKAAKKLDPEPEIFRQTPPAPVEFPREPKSGVSLASVTSKVESANRALADARKRRSVTAETTMLETRMHSSLADAKKALSEGNETAATRSLATADSLASKIIESVAR